ncbi:hypothetical protein ABE95_028770 [Escherichia coli]|uniref:Uncharacterized protein n=1 Tax=Shigella boydii TaxID=621 RepID=A0A1S9J2U1_SHIBO|nr:hypothetical protein CGC46_29015 [Escherichia coli O121:H19]AWJ30430.1 hypothetical protein I3S_29030 [Escherichia coli O121 str. RM8352]OOO77226.1 hypothetical protein AJR17_020695 [Shigella boydii]OTD14520.1 hypothetical protein AW092_27025 [Escherichia coli]OTD15637.1 hypothetical protein AW091_26245 [Escherichia coli]
MRKRHFSSVVDSSSRFSDTGRLCAVRAELPGSLCPQSVTAQACHHGFYVKSKRKPTAVCSH